jgi:hypothetical protein
MGDGVDPARQRRMIERPRQVLSYPFDPVELRVNRARNREHLVAWCQPPDQV